MAGGGMLGWAPGEFTDDTAMAIVQAESLLRCRGIDGADLFAAFRTWAASSPDVGVAASCAAARALSAVTHGDPATGWGCAIHHAMVRAALHRDDPFAALAQVLDALPRDQHHYRTLLAPGWQPAHGALHNGTVWTCIAQAVWAVRHAGSFAEALTAVIDLGGDTDTVAAVAGGLAGAVHGIDAIPPGWVAPLHGHVGMADGVVTWRAGHLADLTHRLLDAGGSMSAAHGEAVA
jgi:ADP-ribosyl-[dinitrogen reductase] hydrolase